MLRLEYSLGVIGSYIFLLIAILYYDWGVTQLFLSFSVEFLLGTAVYAFVNTFFNHALSFKTITLSILVAGLVLTMFQLGWVSILAIELGEAHDDESFWNKILTEHSIWVLILFLGVYSVNVMFRYKKENSFDFVADGYFTKGFILFGVVTAAFFVVFMFGSKSVIFIATSAVLIRVLMELYFNRKV